jgi:hypothetical protein
MPEIARRAAAVTRSSTIAVVVISYAVWALALRAFNFGNPVLHPDEQFYFLVGQRMLHGLLPYVDIWDRKPLGIFLIYAAIARVGGGGVLAYQWTATVFAIAGACLVRAIALETTPFANLPAARFWRSGAWWAGVFYLLWLDVYSCSGGQTPVFYNPLVALAGLIALRLAKAADARAVWRHGWIVMLLLGLALDIKQTVLFEGCALGLALLWSAHRRDPDRSRLALLLLALGWMLVALVPTGLGLAWYAAIGHFPAIWQATFVSSLVRGHEFQETSLRLLRQLALAIPIWLAVRTSGRIWREQADGKPIPADVVVLRVWAAASLGGFLVFGIYYDHYMAPLLVPFWALAAPALGLDLKARTRTLAFLFVGAIAALLVTLQSRHDRGNAEQIARATRLIASRIGGGCMYIYEGPTILYHTTNACLVSRFVFPDHLGNALEASALGVDTAAEMRAILARKPRIIVTATHLVIKYTPNRAVHAILVSGLASDYRPFAVVPIGRYSLVLYRRMQ